MCTVVSAGAVPSYSYHVELKNFSDARASCANSGGDLATFNSTTEQEVVLPWDIYNKDRDWWVGLHQKDVRKEWYWTNGLQVTWTDWKPGGPDNFRAPSALCARLSNVQFIGNKWWWDDKECSAKYNYVCETIKG